MQQAFADIPSNSDQIGSLLNPQDVTVQAMMTVYAQIMDLMPQLSAHQRYNSPEGTLFQRNILLCVAMICDTEITFREVGSFTSIFTDIIRLDGKLSTIRSFEHVEDNKILFTLHNNDHPIDVCWDLQSETTTLTMDDHRIRRIVGDKTISISMSEIFS